MRCGATYAEHWNGETRQCSKQNGHTDVHSSNAGLINWENDGIHVVEERKMRDAVEEIANVLRQSFYQDPNARLSTSENKESWLRMSRAVLEHIEENWDL